MVPLTLIADRAGAARLLFRFRKASPLLDAARSVMSYDGLTLNRGFIFNR